MQSYLLALFVALAGCTGGGIAGPTDLAGADFAGSDLAPADAGPPDLAMQDLTPFACGGETCRANQMCILLCCGGAGPQCEPMPDGGWTPGMCPQGQMWGFCHDFGGHFMEGCSKPCEPPPAYCKDIPPGCDVSSLCSNKVDPKCQNLGGWMGEPCTLDGTRIVSHCI